MLASCSLLSTTVLKNRVSEKIGVDQILTCDDVGHVAREVEEISCPRAMFMSHRMLSRSRLLFPHC